MAHATGPAHPSGTADEAVYAEACAKAVLSPDAYQYFSGGAGDELTRAANIAAWQRITFRPRILRDVSAVDTTLTIGDVSLTSPILAAPTAYHCLAHRDGEMATATGLGPNRLFVVSTRTTTSFDRIAETGTPWWMQVYVLRNRELTQHLVMRAVEAGAQALMLTGDTPVVGRKNQDRGNLVSDEQYLANFPSGTRRSEVEQSPAVTFTDIAWLQSISSLPVYVKGVLRADDALACLDAGAAGIVVSNHGGRQLDGAIATAEALPEIVAAVNGAVPVLVDGGIRNGRDIAKAIALGATAVLIGRPLLWGLTTNGATGVDAVFTALQDQLRHAMQLLGVTSLAQLTPDLVNR
jgi:4-hydroxymandelate oxidase